MTLASEFFIVSFAREEKACHTKIFRRLSIYSSKRKRKKRFGFGKVQHICLLLNTYICIKTYVKFCKHAHACITRIHTLV